MTSGTTDSLARPWDFPGVDLVNDTASAERILPRLAPGTFEVRMMVPDGFEAYARVFYPFAKPNVTHAPLTRWAEVATRNGRRPHAEMERETITDPADGVLRDPDGFTPDDVLWTLPSGQFSALAEILALHTATTGRTWFCIWDGYGNFGLGSEAGHKLARLHHPMRDYLMYTGPLVAWHVFGDGGHDDAPEYWWPDDRAWCFVTDTDFHWAYVAGSRACIDEIVDSSEIEALETKSNNRARFGMDTINRP